MNKSQDLEEKIFKKLHYPIIPTIDLELNKEEAEILLRLLGGLLSPGPVSVDLYYDIESKLKEYMKFRETQYQRPWTKFDDY